MAVRDVLQCFDALGGAVDDAMQCPDALGGGIAAMVRIGRSNSRGFAGALEESPQTTTWTHETPARDRSGPLCFRISRSGMV